MKKLIYVLPILFLLSLSNTMASEQSLYDFKWLDQDKKVYVLQNKLYPKENTFYIAAGGARNISSTFLDSHGAQLRAGYFFSEDWGVEVLYGTFSSSQSKDAQGIIERQTIPFMRDVESYTNAYLVWSPFYGKLNTFNSIVYFDWTFSLGFAQAKTSDNRRKVETDIDETLTREVNSGLSWATGVKFYLTKHYSLRIDLTAIHIKARRARRDGAAGPVFFTNDFFHSYDLSLGLNYTF